MLVRLYQLQFYIAWRCSREHAGPAVALSFLLAAIVAGLVAFSYAEMASTMPFAGSTYSWINVLFGEFSGWVAGWALLVNTLLP